MWHTLCFIKTHRIFGKCTQGIKKKGEFVCFIVLGTTNSPTFFGGGDIESCDSYMFWCFAQNKTKGLICFSTPLQKILNLKIVRK
jgi:hypothetical protein